MAARLQYGAGLRLSEVVRLRVKDIDLDRGTVTVRQGKGDKDRMSVLPKSLRKEVAAQIERARELWTKDREAGLAGGICRELWRGSFAGRRRPSNGFDSAAPPGRLTLRASLRSVQNASGPRRFFRLRHELEAGREAARAFWRCEVLGEGRRREAWQLEQWEDAIKWYLDWLAACAEGGADHRSLPERVRAAVNSAGSRRGLALRTKQCYGQWASRYAVFAGEDREVMRVETATRFLTSVVDEEDCAY